jgi:hypothetical protein
VARHRARVLAGRSHHWAWVNGATRVERHLMSGEHDIEPDSNQPPILPASNDLRAAAGRLAPANECSASRRRHGTRMRPS